MQICEFSTLTYKAWNFYRVLIQHVWKAGANRHRFARRWLLFVFRMVGLWILMSCFEVRVSFLFFLCNTILLNKLSLYCIHLLQCAPTPPPQYTDILLFLLFFLYRMCIYLFHWHLKFRLVLKLILCLWSLCGQTLRGKTVTCKTLIKIRLPLHVFTCLPAVLPVSLSIVDHPQNGFQQSVSQRECAI